ncbi:hypothetical protein AALK94_17105, partial [Bacteroides faecichinchillae]|uniref:hypothetical protein n=1 Tax=Bacteroides faecichinchillae TaxID=871325 RepID=UPI00351952A5
MKQAHISAHRVAGQLKAPAYLLYPHPQCVTLENVCYLCCHSRNDFIPPVKTGIKSTKNTLPDMNCTPKVRHKTLGVQFFMKYSFEEKLNVVSEITCGKTLES